MHAALLKSGNSSGLGIFINVEAEYIAQRKLRSGMLLTRVAPGRGNMQSAVAPHNQRGCSGVPMFAKRGPKNSANHVYNTGDLVPVDVTIGGITEGLLCTGEVVAIGSALISGGNGMLVKRTHDEIECPIIGWSECEIDLRGKPSQMIPIRTQE